MNGHGYVTNAELLEALDGAERDYRAALATIGSGAKHRAEYFGKVKEALLEGRVKDAARLQGLALSPIDTSAAQAASARIDFILSLLARV